MNNFALHLENTVGEDFTAASIRTQLAETNGAPVTIHINSGGGFATEGLAIFHALKDHPGRVTVVIDALAASAASLIAMAGDEIVMRQGALIMIHDPSGMTIGTTADHQQTAGAMLNTSACSGRANKRLHVL